MPLFLRASPSKRKLAETTSSTPSSPLPSLPPPAQLESPFQLQFPFEPSASLCLFDDDAPGPSRSGTGSSSSASSSSSSAGGRTAETAPTTTSGSGSDVSLDCNRWSVLDIDAARTTQEASNGGKEGQRDQEDEKSLRKKSSSGSVKGLKGLFGGRRRSASRGSEKGKEREMEEEEIPPVPSLPPTIGLLDLSLSSFDGGRDGSAGREQQATVGIHGVLTPPEEPANTFSSSPSTTAEDDDLGSLLRLVHAAGDKAFVDENEEEQTPYVPPTPQPIVKPFSLASPPSASPSSFRTPPLAFSSTFSTPTSSLTPTPSASTTPTPRYSFLSRPAQKGTKPSSSSFLSPFTSSKSSLLTPPTTPPLRDDGGEDDYGAASDEDEAGGGEGSNRKSAPRSSSTRRPSSALGLSPRIARTPSPLAGTSPRRQASRSPSSPSAATHFPRTPRRRPLGPRATHLLSLTVTRLSPLPSPSLSPSSPITQPSTALPAPVSTHPSWAVRVAHSHRQLQPLGRTLGGLAVLKKLQRGMTMLEALEVESRPSSSSSGGEVSPYLDHRASVISASARLSIVSTDSGEEGGATSGLNGTSGRSLELWELEHGKLDEEGMLRRVLDVDEPAILQPANPSPAAAIPLTRVKEWAARPSFLERVSETRVVYLPSSHGKGGVKAEGVVVTDIVRPARVGGLGGVRVGRAEVSARVRGLVAALERGEELTVRSAGGGEERPTREKKPLVGLLNSPAAGGAEEDETLSPALRAAAAGAASSPSPATAKRGTRQGGGGLKKPLLPGPLLLRALAEEGEDDVEARRAEAREKLEGGHVKEEGGPEEEDEDDRPLGQLKEQYRASLLPAPRRTLSSSPNRSSTAPQSALLFAQQRAARLESEVARLKAREAEAIEREERLRREQVEKEQARVREEREKVLQRRSEEQRRRSRIANGGGAALAGRKEDKERKSPRRSSTLPHANETTAYPYSPQQQNYLAVPHPYGVPTFAVPIPVPVPMPFYQVPVLSSSAPDFQQLQTPQPTPAFRAPSPSPPGLPGSTSRRSLQPPPVLAPPFSPPRQTQKDRQPPRSPHLPPSASQPHLPSRDSSSPSTPTSKRQSSQPPPPAPRLPHSHSSPATTAAKLSTTPTAKRVSHQPFLSPSHVSLATAMPPTVIGRSRSSPLLASPQRDGGRGTSPKRPAKTGGAAFLGVEGGRRRDGVAG